MRTTLVTVLIVTWNRKKDVLETVQSVYGQAYNASVDETSALVRKLYPDVKLIELERNLGATGGRNAGIKIAQGEIILCLDSDASLGQDTIQNIVWRFDEDQDIGVINSKIVNAYTHKYDGIAGWAYSEKMRAKSEDEFYTHNFSEGGCAIRKQAFEDAGFFWEKLFFGREGEELSLRVLDAGYKILYYPSAIVYHRVSPEKRIFSSERQYYDLRNSLYIYLVRYPWWMFSWFIPAKIFTSMIRGLRQRNIAWVFRAIIEVIKELPMLWKERKPIQNDTARIYLRFQREQGALSWGLVNWLKHKI
jgi:GT2 family glycosyltransferase